MNKCICGEKDCTGGQVLLRTNSFEEQESIKALFKTKHPSCQHVWMVTEWMNEFFEGKTVGQRAISYRCSKCMEEYKANN